MLRDIIAPKFSLGITPTRDEITGRFLGQMSTSWIWPKDWVPYAQHTVQSAHAWLLVLTVNRCVCCHVKRTIVADYNL